MFRIDIRDETAKPSRCPNSESECVRAKCTLKKKETILRRNPERSGGMTPYQHRCEQGGAEKGHGHLLSTFWMRDRLY
jgi:hypothetical protein